MKKTLGRVRKTTRGFEYIEFKDHNDDRCSLQQSSIAIYELPGSSAIWLGRESDVPNPGRMHLNVDQVTALIKHLNSWLDNNTFKLS